MRWRIWKERSSVGTSMFPDNLQDMASRAQSAVELLELKKNEVMMVAAHPSDLQAASKLGLRTAFVPRPLEHGPDREPEKPDPDAVDIVARDFNDLATKLGA